MKINTNIYNNLTSDEKEIFSILMDVVNKKTPSTTIRAAGGWVRDKLIGIDSNDIDIMVDNMSGEKFAKLVTEYLGSKEANVIRTNPEKSKHVETAKAYIPLSSGKIQEIDFARARQEVYKEDSRIPNIKPATAKEDAYRRDLTINSLFYNINKKEIEDFTGMGIKDLITGNIRTPEDPVKTFSDDPLRIFRIIRFASKYNGNIDEETYKALMNPSIRDDIKNKISKERIGIEISKMLKNPNPEKAINILYQTGLWQDILNEALKGTKFEGKMAPLNMTQNNPHHKLDLWGHTMQVVKNVLDKYPETEPEKRAIMILSALMHDLGKLYYEIQTESKSHPGRTSYIGHEKESKEIAEHILRYLRIEPLIAQVAGLAQNHMKPHSLLEKPNIKTLRKFIRQMGEKSLNWLDIFNLSVADASSKDIEIDPNIIQKYNELEAQLQNALISMQQVSQEEKIQPILDGNEIMNALNIKAGPWMKELTEFVKELKDENPDISKEEAIEKLKNQYTDINANQKTSNSKNKRSSICPEPIIKQHQKKIQNLKKNKKYYELFSLIKQLLNDYGHSEKIIKLVCINMLFLLLKDSKFKDTNMLQFIFTKAKNNFFDPVLCSYVTGILILEKTNTKPKVILEIGNRMAIMSPETLKSVLDLLPSNRIYHPEIKNKLMSKLK